MFPSRSLTVMMSVAVHRVAAVEEWIFLRTRISYYPSSTSIHRGAATSTERTCRIYSWASACICLDHKYAVSWKKFVWKITLLTSKYNCNWFLNHNFLNDIIIISSTRGTFCPDSGLTSSGALWRAKYPVTQPAIGTATTDRA